MFCKDHMDDDMINVTSQKCAIDGCSGYPMFQYLGDDKTLYCGDHKDKNMVVRTNRRCKYEGCIKASSFNHPGQTQGAFCKSHKVDGMIDVTHRYCQKEGCTTRCVFGYIGSSPTKCFQHKLPNMVDVTRRICEEEGCNETAYYSFTPSKKPVKCRLHQEEGMSNIRTRDKMCTEPGCKLYPSYGYMKRKPEKCSEHKLEDMIDVIHKKCVYEGCTKKIQRLMTRVP